mgnify:FL=1
MDLNYKNKWLIFIGAGKWQKKAILKAKQIGFKVLSIDSNPKAEGLKFSNLKIIKKTDSEVLRKIKKIDKNYIGVISYCNDAGMLLASKVRKKFRLKGPSEKISKIMTNKILQRKLWNKYKIPCPRWMSIDKKTINSNNFKIKLNFPVIVKPSDSAGSRGIIKVKKNNEIFNALHKSLKFSKENKIIIEEYFQGVEYTVESFSSNKKNYILAITKKSKVPFTNNTVASSLETIDENTKLFKSLKKLAIKSLKALNYVEGTAHTEILYNTKINKKILVETAGRGGGFQLYDGLVKRASNEDIIEKTIMHSTGKSVVFNLYKRNHAILKFFTGRKGIVKKIIGFNLLKKHISEEVNIVGAPFVKKNEKINDTTTDNDRLGYLLAWGKNKKKIKKIINKFDKKIKFKII